MPFKERKLIIPQIMLIAGTRLALGIGIGLLIADWLTPDQRVGAGWALVTVGVLTTIPLLLEVFEKKTGKE